MGSAYAQSAKSDKTSDDSKKHQMSAQELKQRLDKGEKVIVVDARHNLNGQIIKNAVHVPTDELAEWANRIKLSGASRVWVYFNNDNDAHAPRNATSMSRLLRSARVTAAADESNRSSPT